MKNDETKLMKTLSREMVLDMSPFLKVEKHRVGLPDGNVVEDWPWVITPDYVCVVVITKDGRFLVYRTGMLWKIGRGSSLSSIYPPTGYQSSHWENLGQFAVDGNRGNGMAYFFLARDAIKVVEPNADDLEEQEMLFLSRAEVEAALARGAFKVLPWQAIMALALLRL